MVSLASLAVAQNRLSLSQQNQIIEKARQIALEYTAALPNFFGTETIRWSWLLKGSWKSGDTVTVDVAFSDKVRPFAAHDWHRVW